MVAAGTCLGAAVAHLVQDEATRVQHGAPNRARVTAHAVSTYSPSLFTHCTVCTCGTHAGPRVARLDPPRTELKSTIRKQFVDVS